MHTIVRVSTPSLAFSGFFLPAPWRSSCPLVVQCAYQSSEMCLECVYLPSRGEIGPMEAS